RYTARTMTHVFPSGRRETLRLRLASGKTVDATANHPFLTVEGWRPLGAVRMGSRIATPRHLPAPLKPTPWAVDEIVMLAHLLGDGSFVRGQPVRYASREAANLAAVTEAARHFGVTPIRDEDAAAPVCTLTLGPPGRLARDGRNPLVEWLAGLALFGLRSDETFVPAGVFCLPKRQLTLFLRHLWATGGSMRNGRIDCSSTSRRLLEDLSRLLLRYGITASLRTVTPSRHRPRHTLDICGRDDQLRFLREIGVHGRAERCRELTTRQVSPAGTPTVDTIPREVWGRVRAILTDEGTSDRQLAVAPDTSVSGSRVATHAQGRQRLARVAAVLDDVDLDLHATNDVVWDEVVAIEALGERDVFDATVMGVHNFIANGVATHNSIEQDADVVILLHRDDYYDKESPRAGEADFIVAKHRNGPTDTVTVAAQLHLSRFVDMAIV
ncbi:MAG TPA: LAGLIDADG family homing endonuclease, partial [Asanoa sp.]